MWVDQMTQIEAGKQFLEGEQLAKFEKAAGPEAEIAVLKETLTEDQWRDVRQSTARSKAWIQLMIAIGAIAGCFIAPVLGGMWGRRPVYFLLCLLSLASCAYLFRFLDTFNLWFMIVVWFVSTVTAAFLRMVAALPAGAFPDARQGNRSGVGFNFGRILAAIGVLHGRPRCPVRRRLRPGDGGDHAGVSRRHGPDLVGSRKRRVSRCRTDADQEYS